MKPTWDTYSCEDYPVGSKLRKTAGLTPSFKPGLLAHVRAHVDGLVVIRWWRSGKQRWEYEVIGPAAFTQEGLWFPETWWQREGKAEAWAESARRLAAGRPAAPLGWLPRGGFDVIDRS